MPTYKTIGKDRDRTPEDFNTLSTYRKRQHEIERMKKKVYEAMKELTDFADAQQVEVYMTFPTLESKSGMGLTYCPKGTPVEMDDPDWDYNWKESSEHTRDVGEWLSSSANC